ncbi:MAG: acyltransferase [Gammaproteobacteria bacterium]
MSQHITQTGRSAAMNPAASAYLDALRALGANLVVAAHVLALYFGIKRYPLGSLGVMIFFLLSGFLIMQSMLARAGRPGPQTAGFLADRSARILTPYVPALLLIVLIDSLWIRGNYNSGGTNTGALAFFGNLLLLQDHSVFQFLELVGAGVAWRIRPYNSAEPFWTVAIEMWIYVAAGLFFFCAVRRERIARLWLILLTLVSFPVVVWNAAAGGGKSLTLIWLVGALIGFVFFHWRAHGYANSRLIAAVMVLFGMGALVGRIGKVGFSPYDLQTAALIAIVLFGVLAHLVTRASISPRWQRVLERLAAYSYSLYLLHNTILIAVLESLPVKDLRIRAAIAVVLAHACSYLLYWSFERHYRALAAWLRPRFEMILRARQTSEAASPRPAMGADLAARKS